MTTPASPGTTYSWARNDTPEKVAKKHDHKSFDAIWDHRENAGLRRKRKEAEKLEAGDALFIPPSPAVLAAARKGYEGCRKQLEQAEAKLTKALGNQEKLRRSIDTSFKQILSDLGSGKSRMETNLELVDLAGFVATWTSAMATTAAKAVETGELCAKELADFAQSRLVELGTFSNDKLLGSSLKELQEKNDILLAGNQLLKATTNLTSPTFWAKMVYFASEQKSLGDFVKNLPQAYIAEPTVDIDKAIKVTEGLRYEHLKRIDNTIKALQARIASAKRGQQVCDDALAQMK